VIWVFGKSEYFYKLGWTRVDKLPGDLPVGRVPRLLRPPVTISAMGKADLGQAAQRNPLIATNPASLIMSLFGVDRKWLVRVQIDAIDQTQTSSLIAFVADVKPYSACYIMDGLRVEKTAVP